MRKLLIPAVVVLAACAGRTEEETGAAPARDTMAGDTAAVTHQVSPERTGPPGVAGRPGDATVTPDSIPGLEDADSATDQTATPDDGLVGQDTSAPGGPGMMRDTITEADPPGVDQDTIGQYRP